MHIQPPTMRALWNSNTEALVYRWKREAEDLKRKANGTGERWMSTPASKQPTGWLCMTLAPAFPMVVHPDKCANVCKCHCLWNLDIGRHTYHLSSHHLSAQVTFKDAWNPVPRANCKNYSIPFTLLSCVFLIKCFYFSLDGRTSSDLARKYVKFVSCLDSNLGVHFCPTVHL